MIRDLDGNELGSLSLSLESTQSVTGQIKVDCKDNLRLYATTENDIVVEARKTGQSSWINISVGSINLTTWSGTTQDFDIRLTAPLVNLQSFNKIRVMVSL